MSGHEHRMTDGGMLRHMHGHTHPHTQTAAVLERMARVIGQMETIRQLIEEGEDCSEVLMRISAVDAALQDVARTVLKDHLEHCIVDAVQEGDREALEKLNAAIDQFIR